MQRKITRGRVGRASRIAVAIGVLLAVAGLMSPSAGASSKVAEPTPFDGNQKCSDFGYDYELKINGVPSETTYEVGDPGVEELPANGVPDGATITIDNVESPGGRLEFDWSSNIDWGAVIVKQANGGLLYPYVPAADNDQDVQTVEGQNAGGISHVSFCGPGQSSEEPCEFDPDLAADDPACGVCEEGQTGVFPNCITPQAVLAASIACGSDGLVVTVANTGDAGATVDVLSSGAVVANDLAVPAAGQAQVSVPVAEDVAYAIEVAGVQSFTGTRDCVAVQGAVVERPAAAVQPTQVAAAAQQLPRTGRSTVPLTLLGLGLILMGSGALLLSRDRLVAE